MKKVFLIFIFYISAFAKDMIVGFDINMHPRFAKKEGKLAVKILTKEILKTWIKKSDFTGFKTKIYDSADTLINDYLNEKLDVILLNPKDYTKNYKQISQNTSQSISIKHYNDLRINLGYVVSKDKANKPISYWRGKKVTCSDNYLPFDFTNLYLLEHYKTNMNDFFSSIHKARTSGLVIMDVFFKKTKIGITTKQAYDLSAELNPQVKKKLSFVSFVSYPDVPIFISFNNSVPKLDVEFMKEAMKNVFNSARGEQVKSLLQIERVSAISDEDLKFIIDSYNKLEKLNKKY